ncbi:hypothetical protein [Amorphus sp. 3PC139-8]|uniref:hypothetical protein n=1 Tax=Amorphus sp. 3PC139-8 TaxID=2735676 RepID=UPI00345CCEFC
MKYGYILAGPGRPEVAEQRKVLGILGVDTNDEEAFRLDKIKRGAPRPRSQLVGRNEILDKAQPGDAVVVSAAYCLGVSANDAAWFLQELSNRTVRVVVGGDLALVEPGDDVTFLLQAVRTRQNVTHARASEARRQKAVRNPDKCSDAK